MCEVQAAMPGLYSSWSASHGWHCRQLWVWPQIRSWHRSGGLSVLPPAQILLFIDSLEKHSLSISYVPSSMPCAGSQLGMRYRSYLQGTQVCQARSWLRQAHRLSLHEQGSYSKTAWHLLIPVRDSVTDSSSRFILKITYEWKNIRRHFKKLSSPFSPFL